MNKKNGIRINTLIKSMASGSCFTFGYYELVSKNTTLALMLGADGVTFALMAKTDKENS